jgi:large subunit ribosomal protein L47
VPQTSSILATPISDFTDVAHDSNTEKVTTGRAWRAEELRLKSDDDLNKLWFVLVKEETTLLGDSYLKKQKYTVPGIKPRIDKVKQTKARILTVLRERELVRDKYWKTLEDQYIEKAVEAENTIKAKQHKAAQPTEPKPPRVLTEEQIMKQKKREKAKSMIPNWRFMENKYRRIEMAKAYAKMAKETKTKFIKELSFIGLKLKEKNEADQVKPETEEQHS